MSIAVIISSRLTSPLRMLSTGLASFELGKKSEHLSYNGHDEIGDMVKQYNRMVDEIEESAQKSLQILKGNMPGGRWQSRLHMRSRIRLPL